MKINNMEEELPEYFYKYMRAENVIKLLESKTLWFSSPKNFNDPFDCNVDLLDFTPSHEGIKEFINQKVSGNRATRREEIAKNKRDPFRIKSQVAGQTQTNFHKSGVCCYSEVNDNILMWSHYSDNHKGVCLKFNSSLRTLGTMTAKVNYLSGYLTSNFWHEKGGAIYHLVFTKAADWKYEREIRSIRILDNGAIVFDINLLEEIIFGCRTDAAVIDRIIKITSDKQYKHIKFKKAKQTKSSFTLRIDKL